MSKKLQTATLVVGGYITCNIRDQKVGSKITPHERDQQVGIKNYSS